jgi:hypothetical protein
MAIKLPETLPPEPNPIPCKWCGDLRHWMVGIERGNSPKLVWKAPSEICVTCDDLRDAMQENPTVTKKLYEHLFR